MGNSHNAVGVLLSRCKLICQHTRCHVDKGDLCGLSLTQFDQAAKLFSRV